MLPFAEEINYWRSGQSSPDTWISKARKHVETIGGTWIGDGFGNEAVTGRAAFMAEFEITGDRFRVVWPVLPTKTQKAGSERAARIQAATMLYHDIKARCVSAQVLGARTAFFSYLRLPDGRTAASVALEYALPALLAPASVKLIGVEE